MFRKYSTEVNDVSKPFKREIDRVSEEVHFDIDILYIVHLLGSGANNVEKRKK